MGSVSLNTECLLCGLKGCNSHVNECRYKILSGEQEDGRLPCQPERLQGTCDSQLQRIFKEELSGDQQGNAGEEGG
jgi:hypothetical protein